MVQYTGLITGPFLHTNIYLAMVYEKFRFIGFKAYIFFQNLKLQHSNIGFNKQCDL